MKMATIFPVIIKSGIQSSESGPFCCSDIITPETYIQSSCLSTNHHYYLRRNIDFLTSFLVLTEYHVDMLAQPLIDSMEVFIQLVIQVLIDYFSEIFDGPFLFIESCTVWYTPTPAYLVLTSITAFYEYIFSHCQSLASIKKEKYRSALLSHFLHKMSLYVNWQVRP